MRIPPRPLSPSVYTEVTLFKEQTSKSDFLSFTECLLVFCLQGVLRDQRDLELFDDQFKDAYTPKKVGYFDDDDDESY